MSRLRKGLHEVTVYPKITGADRYGETTTTEGPPQVVQCNVQRVSSTEQADLGLVAVTVYRVKYWPGEHGGTPWPGGPYSRIRWNDADWSQQGEATLTSMSPVTGHYRVLMVKHGTEVT